VTWRHQPSLRDALLSDRHRRLVPVRRNQSTSHGPQEPIAIRFVEKAHPITRGLADWTTIREELYNNVKIFPTAQSLARGKQIIRKKDGSENTADFVVVWANERQSTRL
jgi:hypothetical protein